MTFGRLWLTKRLVVYQSERSAILTSFVRYKYLAINTRLHSSDNSWWELDENVRVFTYSLQKSNMKWSITKALFKFCTTSHLFKNSYICFWCHNNQNWAPQIYTQVRNRYFCKLGPQYLPFCHQLDVDLQKKRSSSPPTQNSGNTACCCPLVFHLP